MYNNDKNNDNNIIFIFSIVLIIIDMYIVLSVLQTQQNKTHIQELTKFIQM